MSHICKIFYCDDLNSNKYELLHKKAECLRDFRNKCSLIINENIETFMSMSLFDWINYFRVKLEYCNNQDVSEAIKLLHINYNLKLDNYLNKISFKIQSKITKMGDVEFKSTQTSKLISYLCKYWSPQLITYLENNINENDKQYLLRKHALELYNKYPERIKNLVKSRHSRIFSDLKKKPILSDSLVFKSCNELRSPILKRNKNERSKYGAIIILGAQKTYGGKIHIPVKYSQDYHGTIKSYEKVGGINKTKKIYYQIEFPKDKVIKIVLTKEIEETPVPTNKENYYGIDVNVKNNLFCDKYGNTIDFDRKMLSDYIKFLKKIDNKTFKKFKNYESCIMSNKDNTKYMKWKCRFDNMLNAQINKLIINCEYLNKNHIILEDLTHFGKIYSRSDEFDNMKISRLSNLLNISGLKNIIKRIANKKGIQVTFVQSHYTSQTCKCGHISKNNRKSQEIFKCESCGRELNADVNAASNIEDRLALDVLRSSLLSKDKDGNFQPKKLRKETIKFILHDFYSSQQQVEIVDSTKHLNRS